MLLLKLIRWLQFVHPIVKGALTIGPMTSIAIKKYYPTAAPLKSLIKYFWVLDSGRHISLHHKILPVNNIDILINLKSPMTFEKKGVTYKTPGNIYFQGLNGDHTLMQQEGTVLTIGVSFFPTGFFPFFKIPVSEFKDDTIGLDVLLNALTTELEDKLRAAKTMAAKITILEQFFLGLLDQHPIISRETTALFHQFYTAGLPVRAFCREYGVHPRTLERRFNRFVGVTPKQFYRLSRFQVVLNKLIRPPQATLTDLAHDLDYYDQAHFIKDFKAFTGCAPSDFLKEKQSFKQIMTIL